jgi:hypothetical protein
MYACLVFLSFLNVQQPKRKEKNMTKQQEIVAIIVNKRANVLNPKTNEQTKRKKKHIHCPPMDIKKQDNCQDDILFFLLQSKKCKRDKYMYVRTTKITVIGSMT